MYKLYIIEYNRIQIIVTVLEYEKVSKMRKNHFLLHYFATIKIPYILLTFRCFAIRVPSGPQIVQVLNNLSPSLSGIVPPTT